MGAAVDDQESETSVLRVRRIGNSVGLVLPKQALAHLKAGEGDTLVLLESMKMEIPVLAEVAGTVSKVSVSVGDVIQAGDLIAVIS